MGIKLIRGHLAALLASVCLFGTALNAAAPSSAASEKESWLSPTALSATADGKSIFIACATANEVAVFDTASGKITRTTAMPATPTGLTLSKDGSLLFVTCAAPSSSVCIVEAASGKIMDKIQVGYAAMSPVCSPDGKTLYVCNRFNHDVSIIDLVSKKEIVRVPVTREPIDSAITPDGKLLLVVNHLPTGRSDASQVSAVVSVVETATRKVIREIVLPNGSTTVRDIRVSPDGKYACVSHVLARFHLPTTQVDRGWMSTNGLSLIDLLNLKLLNTVLLDNVDSGAANPWAIAWTADGKTITVTHAGTHELSVIDATALLERLRKMPATAPAGNNTPVFSASQTADDVPNDLAFLVDVRKRIKLDGKGPRASVVIGNKIYVANYFSDNLNVIDLEARFTTVVAIPLAAPHEMSAVRRGELLFNDGTMCFQGWQSCASCHSSDARVDSLNWDLLNDGLGNPKNTKSLLLSHQTPPAMSMGVRDTAETAVRAGIRHILFTERPESDAVAIDEWLKSLKPAPSPYLVDGKLSAAARRGQELFSSSTVGCAKCHTPGLFTDLKHHDVGTVGQFDEPDDIFDTPTLIENWRTAPYLHDGSAVTMRDVLTTSNRQDKHGKTSHLTPQQIEDLAAYVLSL